MQTLWNTNQRNWHIRWEEDKTSGKWSILNPKEKGIVFISEFLYCKQMVMVVGGVLWEDQTEMPVWWAYTSVSAFTLRRQNQKYSLPSPLPLAPVENTLTPTVALHFQAQLPSVTPEEKEDEEESFLWKSIFVSNCARSCLVDPALHWALIKITPRTWLLGDLLGMEGWLAGWLAVWLAVWLIASWLVGWLVGWLVDCLLGWPVSWTIAYLTGCLTGWLTGWLAGWIFLQHIGSRSWILAVREMMWWIFLGMLETTIQSLCKR